MDIVSSAVTGALRIGVQVVIARRRPVLEILYHLHNDYRPRGQDHHFQHVFVSLFLVNMGGARAENITFETSGDFRRELFKGGEPALLKSTIEQMAPGQAHYLMKIEQGDLHEWLQDEKHATAKTMGKLKTASLGITVHYDAERTIISRLLRLVRSWRGLKQYETKFIFNPQNFAGDLPPPNYL